MEKLLEIHKLPKPVQEEREILWVSEFCWNLRIYDNDWIFSSMNLLKFVLNVTNEQEKILWTVCFWLNLCYMFIKKMDSGASLPGF